MVVTNKTDTGIISGSYATQNIPAKLSGNEELKEKLVPDSNTCGVCMSTTSDRFVKILDFRHFERFFTFSKSDRKTYKKAVSDGVNVSVVLDVGCGNTSK